MEFARGRARRIAGLLEEMAAEIYDGLTRSGDDVDPETSQFLKGQAATYQHCAQILRREFQVR